MAIASDIIRYQPRALLRAGLACWLAFALVAWWACSSRSMTFDAAGLELWRTAAGHKAIGPAWLTDIMRVFTRLGSGPVRLVLAGCMLVLLLALRRWRIALVLALSALPSSFINSELKQMFARPRPQLVEHLASAEGLSFPSGHAFNSAAVFLAVAIALSALTRNTAARRLIVAAALLLSMLVGFSRVWLGVHYPTDVIAGWLGGVGWVLMVQALAGTEPTSEPGTIPA